MSTLRWGIIGCGDVTEVKSGPGFQKAEGSALVAVMRRDVAKARDYARRHGVPRVHERADDLIQDPEVDAVYIATPPSTHCELALAVAAAGKPCLVEKPMALTHAECLRMVDGFAARSGSALGRLLPARSSPVPAGARPAGGCRHRARRRRSTSRSRRRSPPARRRPAGASTQRSQAPGCSSTSPHTASTCSTSWSVRSPRCRGLPPTPAALTRRRT